jgi:hypothetical protein
MMPNAATLAHYQSLLKSTSEEQLRAFAHARSTSSTASRASAPSAPSQPPSST